MFTRPAHPAAAAPPDSTEVPAAEAAPAETAADLVAAQLAGPLEGPGDCAVPLVLATAFGGLRITGAMANSNGLRLAATRADVIPAITKYMSALDVALLASSTRRDVEGAKKNFEARTYELQTAAGGHRRHRRRPVGVSTLLNGGQALLDKVAARQHRFAGPGDHLCADPVDGRGRRSTRRCASTMSRSAPRRRA